MTQFDLRGFFNAQNDGATPAPAASPAPASTTAPAGSAPATTNTSPTGTPVATTVADGTSEPKPTGTPQGEVSPWGSLLTFLPFILIIFFMFFMMSRSRKKQAKEAEAMYNSLKRDDRVMLQSGKFVVIDTIEKDRVVVFADADRRVKEEYHRNAIAGRAEKYTGQGAGK